MAEKKPAVNGVSPITILSVYPEVVIVLAHPDSIGQLSKPQGKIVGMDFTGGLFSKAASPTVRSHSCASSTCALTTPPCALLPSPSPCAPAQKQELRVLVIATWAGASIPGYTQGKGTSIVIVAITNRYRSDELEVVLEHISRVLRRSCSASRAARVPAVWHPQVADPACSHPATRPDCVWSPSVFITDNDKASQNALTWMFHRKTFHQWLRWLECELIEYVTANGQVLAPGDAPRSAEGASRPCRTGGARGAVCLTPWLSSPPFPRRGDRQRGGVQEASGPAPQVLRLARPQGAGAAHHEVRQGVHTPDLIMCAPPCGQHACAARPVAPAARCAWGVQPVAWRRVN